MALTLYQPWGLLNQLQKELERSYNSNGAEGSIATAEWSPSVDIKEDADRFIIHADIPGVKPEEIDISMENSVLTIKGEKKTEATTESTGYKRVERAYGTFYRRFSLPDSANPDAISAKSANGVLEIIIPKRDAIKPTKINIEVSWHLIVFNIYICKSHLLIIINFKLWLKKNPWSIYMVQGFLIPSWLLLHSQPDYLIKLDESWN